MCVCALFFCRDTAERGEEHFETSTVLFEEDVPGYLAGLACLCVCVLVFAEQWCLSECVCWSAVVVVVRGIQYSVIIFLLLNDTSLLTRNESIM